MSLLPFTQTSLERAVSALEKDLLAEGGPTISTMRKYRFAILPYRPSDEIKLRQLVRGLTDRLKMEGFGVLPISLQKLLLERIRATGAANVEALIAREKRLFSRDPERALAHVREKIAPHIEGPEGLAADVVRLINTFASEHPDRFDRTLVLLGRAGALYPFFRSSALLKHIDGKTRSLPVVLLYPGTCEMQGDAIALRFMGEVAADRDYRPRIYV